MTSSQPLAFSFAVCTEPLPVTVVFASAVSSLMSVLPVVTMVEAALVSRSQTEASSERLAPSPVTVTSEKPPAFAERPLSESEAEDCTSAVPILVEPVAITVGLMPIGLETMRFIAVTPSERDVAAADDDIALDGDVVQVDVAGEHALCDVEIALDGRVRQRAGRRDGDVLRVVVEGGVSVLPGLAERRAEVEVQDLGDLAAPEVALRLEGAVSVAVDVALRDRLGDVARRVGGDFGLVGEHIELGRGRGRCILVQAAENGRGLLAGQRAFRVHPVVAHAVDVAVLDGDLDGLIVRIRAFDIGKADGCLFGEVKRAVDVAHEFPARDRGLRGIVAGRGGGVDDAELVERGHIGLRPVRVDVGRERCRDRAGEQGRRQKGGEKIVSVSKVITSYYL